MSIWIYWYVCISELCQCAMCQALIIISCIHCCLASIFSLQCTTNNTSNDTLICSRTVNEAAVKKEYHGPYILYSLCSATNHAMGLKTRTKTLDLALKQRTRALTSRQHCSQTSNTGFFEELQVNSQHLPEAD